MQNTPKSSITITSIMLILISSPPEYPVRSCNFLRLVQFSMRLMSLSKKLKSLSTVTILIRILMIWKPSFWGCWHLPKSLPTAKKKYYVLILPYFRLWSPDQPNKPHPSKIKPNYRALNIRGQIVKPDPKNNNPRPTAENGHWPNRCSERQSPHQWG